MGYSAKLARLLARLPGTSSVFGPPRGYLECIRSISPGEGRVVAELRPERTVVHPVPGLSPYDEVETVIRDSFSVVPADAQRLYHLRGARILGNRYGHGLITNRDRFLLDQHETWGQPITNHPIHYASLLPRCRRLGGVSFSLISHWSDNYWHWLFDVLGKWLLLRDHPSMRDVDHFPVIGLNRSTFKRASLERLGFDSGKLVDVESDSHLRCENLLVADRPFTTPYPEQDVVAVLRKAMVRSGVLEVPHRRIYISRKRATTRRIQNEADLERALGGLGFETVCLEDLRFEEQIALFQSADYVFAQHGAGLTNLLFCRPGTRVVELFEPEFINPCYALLARKVGLRYQMVLNSGAATGKVTFHWGSIPNSVRVDADMIASTIGRLEQ